MREAGTAAHRARSTDDEQRRFHTATRWSPGRGRRNVVVEREPVEVSCGGSPEPEPTGTYDYYGNDDTDESCSADTTSDYESGQEDTDCSSDTSGGSDTSEDVDCSSDSSSTSSTSSDDSCSGDSSTSETSGYDGDTCTGQAAPREGSERRAQGRPKRLKTSLWSLAFAAVVLPIRRRKRGTNASG